MIKPIPANSSPMNQPFMKIQPSSIPKLLLSARGPLRLVRAINIVLGAPRVNYNRRVIKECIQRAAYNGCVRHGCRHEGLPFRYPGTRYTWEHFCDMSDARVLAEQHIWAAVTAHAKNQAFNSTNGDVFTWKSLWKVLCVIFDVEFVPFDESDEFDFVEMMKEKGKVWDDLVEKYGLHKTKLEEITCFVALDNVLHFGFQHVCSMNKSREFGFFGHADTLKSIGKWVDRLREMNIIP